MTDERHEKALEAAVHAEGFTPNEADRRVVARAIAAYLQAMDAVIVPKEPVAWRYRYNGSPSKKWTVQKNKPEWYRPTMRDVELEPLFALSPNHFTNGE